MDQMGLKAQMEGLIPGDALASLSDHFDVIGDVAVLSLPPVLEDYKRPIAMAILEGRKNLSTVLNKVSKTRGNSRTAMYEVLAGEHTTTTHREFGHRYRLDVSRVFFTPRLAYERNRVSAQVKAGERVLVPFCGVGPFLVPAAARGAEVIGIEMNPEACRWCAENARLNNVQATVTIIRGDAAQMPLAGDYRCDRLIIPTPYGMDSLIDRLSPYVSPQGKVHFYTFRKHHQIPGMIRSFGERGLAVAYYRRCGNVAPGVSRWVFDLVPSGSDRHR